jgi:hypothetical protein
MINVTKTPATRSNTNDTSIRQLADREVEAVAGARNFRAEMERAMVRHGGGLVINPQFYL